MTLPTGLEGDDAQKLSLRRRKTIGNLTPLGKLTEVVAPTGCVRHSILSSDSAASISWPTIAIGLPVMIDEWPALEDESTDFQ
jgi:hypothetical protein